MSAEQTQLLFGGLAQGPFVADDDSQTAGAQHFAGAAQGQAEGIGVHYLLAFELAIGAYQTVEQLQQALLAASGFYLVVFAVAKNKPAHTIVMGQRRPANQARNLRGQHRFELQAAAEEQLLALLDKQVDWTFAFFVEQLGVRLLGARRDTPVNGPYVIAWLIDAHLVEIDATPAQFGMMQAHQRTAPVRCREQWNLAYPVANVDQLGEGHPRAGRFLAQLLASGLHQATATTSRMRCRTRSWSMPAASASKERIRRWRSTSKNIAWMSSGLTKSRPASQAWARAQRSRDMVPRGLAP